MKCYNCHYDKLDKKTKNCPICGVDLTQVCEKCNSFIPMGAKFCSSCGTKVTTFVNLTKEEKVDVGVIFADISGFTSLAEEYSSEDTKNIINDCFAAITKPVYELNGEIHKYIGDCVMVIFKKGTINEIAHNTMQCALLMRDYLSTYLTMNQSTIKTLLNVSIGVNIGDVVLGELGTSFDSEYTIIGDTVNIASRLQTYAKPGEVIVSKSIFDITKNVVVYSEAELINVKNKKEALEIYHAVTFNKQLNVNKVYIQREIDSIVNGYINREQNSHILNVTGEPGIGKSLSIDRFINNNSELSFMKIKLTKWDVNNPYSGIVKLLHLLVNSTEDKDVSKQLYNYLTIILAGKETVEINRTYQFLLLILKEERSAEYEVIINSMSYQDLVVEVREQAMLFVSASLQYKNQIIIFENSDFIDEETKSAFMNFEEMPHTIMVSRVKMEEDESILSVKMKRFTSDMVLDYLKQFFDVMISEAMHKRIVTLVKGNPLYLKEVCHVINQHKRIFVDGCLTINETIEYNLPQSMNKLYKTRFDTFNRKTKEVLSLASLFVIEIDFRVINELLEFSYTQELEEELEEMNIIELSGYYRFDNNTVKTYQFTNQDFKEAIKKQMTSKDYKYKHKKIADLLLTDADYQRLDIIALHLKEAQELNLSKEFYLKSAFDNHTKFNVEQAQANFLQYIELEKELDRSAIERNVVQSYIQLASLMIYKGDFIQAIEYVTEGLTLQQTNQELHTLKIQLLECYKGTSNIEKALPLIEDLSKSLQKTSENYGKLLKVQSTVYNMIGKPGVIELVEQSKNILVKTGDFENLSETLAQAGIRYFIQGDIKKGIETLESAMSYSDKAKNKSLTAKIMINLGILYNNYGEEEKANVLFLNAMDISKQISNNSSYVTSAINLGVSYLKTGAFLNAKNTFLESVSRSKKNNLLYQQCVSLTNLGDVYYELGDFDNAQNTYEQSKELAHMMKLPIEGAINNLGLVKTRISTTLDNNDESLLNTLIKEFEDGEELSYVSSCYFTLSDFYISKTNIDEASKAAQKALDYALKSDGSIEEVRALRKQLEIALIQKDTTKAQTLYKNIIKRTTELNQYYELAKTYYTKYIYENNIEYLSLAKEVLVYFDECFLSELIKNN